MKKLTLVVSFLLMAFGSQLFAQEVGKLFDKKEADILFGKVLNSVEISVQKLDEIINIDSDAFMFKIMKGELVILDAHRKTIYPDNRTIDKKEVFYWLSKSKVKEFLGKAVDKTASVEMRKEVLSITSGNLTLEQTAYCPPICWGDETIEKSVLSSNTK